MWQLQRDGTTIPSELECNEHVAIAPYTPHLIEALESNCLLAEWAGDTEKKTRMTFQPYNDLEQCETISLSNDTPTSPSISRIVKAMGKNEVFVFGMAAGLSVGFLLGRRQGR